MQINLRLLGPLRDQLPAETRGRVTLDFEEGAIVQRIFDDLGLPQNLLITINGDNDPAHDTVLHDGDEVVMFTPVNGG